MHDDLLERRLSVALHDEAATLSLNVTAAELERRLALRRRSLAGRRLTLLLAAAVGIGLFGIGGALSGLFDKSLPTQTRLVQATDAAIATRAPEASNAEPVTLPSLDELVAIDPGSVILAQAHGPADRPETPTVSVPSGSAVVLGPLDGFVGTSLSVACLGTDPVELDIRDAPISHQADPSRIHVTGPSIACTGAVTEVDLDGAPRLTIRLLSGAPTSWRVVIRGRRVEDTTVQPFPVLQLADGNQTLVDTGSLSMPAGGGTWGSPSRALLELGAVPGRADYTIQVACAGAPVRVFLGDDAGGTVVARSELQVPCDGGVRETYLRIAYPDGAKAYLAAAPGQLVAVLISSGKPPFSIRGDIPDWASSIEYGPDFAFDGHGVSASAGGAGVDRVQVVLACTGTAPIDVTVKDGTPIGARERHFEATCTPDGTFTARIFRVSAGGMSTSYFAPAGTWTALKILEPDTDK